MGLLDNASTVDMHSSPVQKSPPRGFHQRADKPKTASDRENTHEESPGGTIFAKTADETTKKSAFSILREPSNTPKTAPVGNLSNLTPRERRQKPQEETFVNFNPNLRTREKFGSPKMVSKECTELLPGPQIYPA